MLSFTSYFEYCSDTSTIIAPFGYQVTDCQFSAGLHHINNVSFIAQQSSITLTFAFEDTSYYNSGSYQEIIIDNGMYTSEAIPYREA